jgi:hypothetical protein
LKELFLRLEELILEEGELLPAASRGVYETRLDAGGLLHILRTKDRTVRAQN